MFLNSKLTFYLIDIISLISSIFLAFFLKYGVELNAIIILKNLISEHKFLFVIYITIYLILLFVIESNKSYLKYISFRSIFDFISVITFLSFIFILFIAFNPINESISKTLIFIIYMSLINLGCGVRLILRTYKELFDYFFNIKQKIFFLGYNKDSYEFFIKNYNRNLYKLLGVTIIQNLSFKKEVKDYTLDDLYKKNFNCKILILKQDINKFSYNELIEIQNLFKKDLYIYNEVDNFNEIKQEFSKIKFSDLSGRKEIEFNYKILSTAYEEKKVLVLGAGGSIGSNLILNLLRFKLKKIIFIDNSEIAHYNFKKKLEFNENKLNKIQFYIEDITLTKSIQNIIHKEKPDIVINAAALKHVNLLENKENYQKCLETNFYSNKRLIRVCDRLKIKNYIYISTDKAVYPTTKMGLSKRFAELDMIQYKSKTTELSYVRFGNVFESNGSAIPYFKECIINDKDINLTSKKVKRYFITIEEACNLVLTSIVISSNNKKTNSFILDMGKPILIYDIIKFLAETYGKKINEDFKIKIIGLQKGEKINEELNYKYEILNNTVVPGIKSVNYNNQELKNDNVFKEFSKLIR